MEQLYTPTTPLDLPAPQVAPRRYNALGIASLALSLVTAVGMVLVIVAATVLVANGADESNPAMMVTGLLMFACMGADLIAVGLGIAGLFQAGRGKVTAVIGMILGAATLVTLLLLILVGLAAG